MLCSGHKEFVCLQKGRQLNTQTSDVENADKAAFEADLSLLNLANNCLDPASPHILVLHAGSVDDAGCKLPAFIMQLLQVQCLVCISLAP